MNRVQMDRIKITYQLFAHFPVFLSFLLYFCMRTFNLIQYLLFAHQSDIPMISIIIFCHSIEQEIVAFRIKLSKNRVAMRPMYRCVYEQRNTKLN